MTTGRFTSDPGYTPLTKREPMTEARRQFVYGPLLPMERPEGEPSVGAGTMYVAAGLLLIIAAVLLIAKFHQPQRSSASHPSAATEESAAGRGER